MDDAALSQFFLRPTQTCHRQYEALRAVFVDERSQKIVAEEFGYTHDALRQLVSQFRRRFKSVPPNGPSPFFATPAQAGRASANKSGAVNRRSPTGSS
jgi:hypothetical protein